MSARQLTTAEAAARLGVKPQTLYAYVSRGLLRRQRTTSGSSFDPQEVERLVARSRSGARGRSSPANLAFVTELTLIEDGRLWYRGEDAVELSRDRRFEEIAEWLWSGSRPAGAAEWRVPPATAAVVAAAVTGLGSEAVPSDRYKVAVAAAATVDLWRHHLSPDSVQASARTILSTMVGALPAVCVSTPAENSRHPAAATDPTAGLAARLWPRLSTRPATPERVAVLQAALVLLADHELAASTLAARVAAAFGADPYAVVATGLGAASGVWHAANSTAVVALLEDAQHRGAALAVADRLRHGQQVAGFGQGLYPGGDPRGAELLRRVADLDQPADRRAVVTAVVEVGADRSLPLPSVDFGLAALVFSQSMVPAAGEAIFVLARAAGWIAHAMEEYASRTPFRARATYVGRR